MSMMTSLMALLTTSDWLRVSRRRLNWSSVSIVNMMIAVLALALNCLRPWLIQLYYQLAVIGSELQGDRQ